MIYSSAKTASSLFYGEGDPNALSIGGSPQNTIYLTSTYAYAFTPSSSPAAFTMYFSLDPYGGNPSNSINNLMSSCQITATSGCSLAAGATQSLPAYFFYQDASGAEGGGVVQNAGGTTFDVNMRVALPMTLDNPNGVLVELVSNKEVVSLNTFPTYTLSPSGEYYSYVSGDGLLSVQYQAAATFSVCMIFYQQTLETGPIMGDNDATLSLSSWLIYQSTNGFSFYGFDTAKGSRVASGQSITTSDAGSIGVCMASSGSNVLLCVGNPDTSPTCLGTIYALAQPSAKGIAIANVANSPGSAQISMAVQCLAAWDGALSQAQMATWIQGNNNAYCDQYYLSGTGAVP